MRKPLLILATCLAVLIAAAAATAATKSSPYRAAAAKCLHGRSLTAAVTGSSIGFVRSSFVPCVDKQLRGKKTTSTSALDKAVAHDARVLYQDSAKTKTTDSEACGTIGEKGAVAVADNLICKSAVQICGSATAQWGWLLDDNTGAPKLTYGELAKDLYESFFTSYSGNVGKLAATHFAFSYIHHAFLHDGSPKNPVGIAGVAIACGG